MARVVVVGGGFGGLAAAARLAKLGHEVTVLERSARLGLEPWDVARPKEAKEAGIDLPRDAEHRRDWCAALAAHPRAIQRPIITSDDGSAVIARDEESLDRALRANR